MDNFQATFEAFASFGSAPSKEMDNSHFSKMLKECKIIGKSFTSTDADLLFSKSSGTKADTVRFHDDKSTYTGAAKQGGPTNVDRNAGSLAGVVDRRQETIDNRGTTAKQI
ncbi:p25-alpha family protein [Leishmania donovani]|uniref:p25-alpha family protein n=1 Tax=Leishmania donovani TaxID=5661 RepID=A0A504XPM0_LEIDO|nr:p25-alpha family protein [Leishmania donovani]